MNPDGTMTTEWKLHSNVKWHDGTPFTADDLVFSFTIFKDPEIATTGVQKRFMQSASAPDPHTFVITWSSVYVDADRVTAGVVLPRHLLGAAYQEDKVNLPNHPFFTSDFVGLGPYRLVRWERGSHMELVRFDDYFLGRPPLDRVVIRFVRDPNAMVATILAGDADVVLPSGVDMDAALEVRKRWEGTGNRVQADLTGQLRQLELQHRPDQVRPRNGLSQRAARQAFYQAIDRTAIADASTQNLAPVADSWYAPGEALRPEIESAIPQFPYDPARAQQLLAGTGWARGADGVLVHQPSGERFEVELWAKGGGALDDKETAIVGDYWKAIGAQVILNPIPPARVDDAEYLGLRPGPMITQPPGDSFFRDRTHSSQVQTAANRWTGFNRAGYVNPKVDELIDRLAQTIDGREQVGLHRELLQEQMTDIAFMPLYWEVLPILMVRGVSGPKHVRNFASQKAFTWTRE
jgi:peptide/nickel transport system substrate-binding protein